MTLDNIGLSCSLMAKIPKWRPRACQHPSGVFWPCFNMGPKCGMTDRIAVPRIRPHTSAFSSARTPNPATWTARVITQNHGLHPKTKGIWAIILGTLEVHGRSNGNPGRRCRVVVQVRQHRDQTVWVAAAFAVCADVPRCTNSE